MKTILLILSLYIALALVQGCATGDCSNLPQRPKAEEAKVANPDADEDAQASPTPSFETLKSSHGDTVQVFKDTGELQCGQGKASPLKSFAKRLESSGIKIYASRTGDDGMMHMQVCGSPTGRVHIFEIPSKDLAKARKLGFKELK